MLRQAIYRMSVISVDKLEHPAVALVVTGADVILDRILELVAVCIRVHHLGDRGGCRVVRDLVVVVGAWIIGAFVEWHLCTTRGLRAAHIDEAVVLPDPGLRKSNTDQADQNHEHKQVCQRLGSQGRRHYKQVRTESKGCNARRRCWRLDFQEMRCELFQCSRLLAWPSFSQPTNRFASLNHLILARSLSAIAVLLHLESNSLCLPLRLRMGSAVSKAAPPLVRQIAMPARAVRHVRSLSHVVGRVGSQCAAGRTLHRPYYSPVVAGAVRVIGSSSSCRLTSATVRMYSSDVARHTSSSSGMPSNSNLRASNLHKCMSLA
jgi:hypothetical protein